MAPGGVGSLSCPPCRLPCWLPVPEGGSLAARRQRDQRTEGGSPAASSGGSDMGRIRFASLAGVCAAAVFICIGCGAGGGWNGSVASAAAGDPAENNACKAPEHGRISCTVVCDDGYTACGDLCVRLESDRANCEIGRASCRERGEM